MAKETILIILSIIVLIAVLAFASYINNTYDVCTDGGIACSYKGCYCKYVLECKNCEVCPDCNDFCAEKGKKKIREKSLFEDVPVSDIKVSADGKWQMDMPGFLCSCYCK